VATASCKAIIKAIAMARDSKVSCMFEGGYHKCQNLSERDYDAGPHDPGIYTLDIPCLISSVQKSRRIIGHRDVALILIYG
jgi:hypothetical protein